MMYANSTCCLNPDNVLCVEIYAHESKELWCLKFVQRDECAVYGEWTSNCEELAKRLDRINEQFDGINHQSSSGK